MAIYRELPWNGRINDSIVGTLIDLIFGFIELLLLLRIILKLFGAAPAPFVRWVYVTSQPLVNPFQGMFPSPTLQGGFIIEFSTIFALLIYALIAYFIREFLGYIAYRTSSYRVVEEEDVPVRRGRRVVRS